MTYMAMPNIRIPALGVMQYKILVDPSLVIITVYLVCLSMSGSGGEDF